jgi:aspartyl-tRNA synthetase
MLSVSTESVVLVTGTLVAPVEPVKSCSQQDVELSISKFFVISNAVNQVPFSVSDASRSEVEIQKAAEVKLAI